MFDLHEFEIIADKYRKSLFKYCYYRLNNDTTLTEETLNDIFMVLYRKWDELDLNKNIRAYLYRVADNCIKHNMESNNKYYSNIIPMDEAVEKHGLDDVGYFDDYFQEMDEHDTQKYICRIKASLPVEYQEIYDYRYIQKKTLTEISEIIGLPYSTLRLRLSKLEPLIRDEIKKIFQ